MLLPPKILIIGMTNALSANAGRAFLVLPISQRYLSMQEKDFEPLISFLERIPCISDPVMVGFDDSTWWVKLSLDLDHHLVWVTIQEMGYVLNNLSIDEKLPTVFYPTSPPPYLNGGPEDFLSWVIEGKDKNFSPSLAKKWLEARLPNPVDDVQEWQV